MLLNYSIVIKIWRGEISYIMYTNESSDWFDLAAEKERHSVTDTTIRSIYLERTAWSARKKAYNEKIRCCYSTLRMNEGAIFAWQSLLNDLGRKTDLLSIEPVRPTIGPQPVNTYLDALLHLAMCCDRWKTPSGGLESRNRRFKREFLLACQTPACRLFCAAVHG